MKESAKIQLRKATNITFSISRAFRNVQDLRQWILNPQKDRTNNGFLYIQPQPPADDDKDPENDKEYYKQRR